MDVYPEKEILDVEEFENNGDLNGTDIEFYVHKTAYELLPQKLSIDYSGFLFRKLYVTNYTPVRFRGRC
ncbi:MAG: hypothetical protein ACETWM_16870 [Candidatus Lokiarchaeia archaeon]